MIALTCGPREAKFLKNQVDVSIMTVYRRPPVTKHNCPTSFEIKREERSGAGVRANIIIYGNIIVQEGSVRDEDKSRER